MNKVLFRVGKGLLVISFVILFTYLGFRAREYFVGQHYVNYLRNNVASIPLSEPLHFTSFDQDFYENHLFLVGEIHEVATSPKIDVAMFKNLHQNAGVHNYVAEMDIAQAFYLNQYLKDSTSLSLDQILKKWAVFIGRISPGYRNKWETLKQYSLNLPQNERLQAWGVDKIKDFELLHKLISDKLGLAAIENTPKTGNETRSFWIEHNLDSIITHSPLNGPSKELLDHIRYNILNPDSLKSRDQWMAANFERFFKANGWKNEKLYGCFGFSHTLQGLSHTFAGKLKRNESLGIGAGIVSLNAFYLDSYLAVQSSILPKLLRDDAPFTRFGFSYDNIFTMYIKGIEDFKRVTPKNSISLINLNGENSPYKTSLRATSNFSLLPIWNGIDVEDENSVTTDYIQYLFLVRNADWTKPN